MFKLILLLVLFTQALAAPQTKTTTKKSTAVRSLLPEDPGSNVDGIHRQREIDGDVPAEFLVLFGSGEKRATTQKSAEEKTKKPATVKDTDKDEESQKPNKRDAAKVAVPAKVTSTTKKSTKVESDSKDQVKRESVTKPTTKKSTKVVADAEPTKKPTKKPAKVFPANTKTTTKKSTV